MDQPRIVAHSYEKTDDHPSRFGKGPRHIREFDPERRVFLHTLDVICRKCWIALEMQGMKWPRPETAASAQYKYLGNEPYSLAQLHIVFAHSLMDLGPELGSIITHASERFRHCIVVTDMPVDNDFALEIRESLNRVIPARTWTGGEDLESPLTCPDHLFDIQIPNAELGNLVTYMSLRDAKSDRHQGRLYDLIMNV